MREQIIFHNTIYNTFKQQILQGGSANSENTVIYDEISEEFSQEKQNVYLLLSADEVNIYWTIKLDYQSLTHEFLNLLKFIIPSGVIILGVLFLNIQSERSETSNFDYNEKVKTYYFMLKNYFESSNCNLPCYKIKNLFYSFVLNKKFFERNEIETESLTSGDYSVRCGGKIYKFYEDLDRLDLHEHIRSVKFENLESKFKSDFLLVKTFVNPLVILSKNNCQLNELYSNQMGISFKDLNINILNVTELIELQNDENNEQILSVLEGNKKKLENFLSRTLNSTNVLNCTFLINTEITDSLYFEETNNTFYSIHQDKKNEQILKSIKICVNCLIPVTPTLNILNISSEIINQYNFLLNELHNLNLEKSKTYSLLEFHEENSPCLFPLSILFSYDEVYEQNEESLLNQRKYFHDILSIPEEEPYIRKFRLENKIYYNSSNDLLDQCFEEKVPCNSHLSVRVAGSKYLKNVHSNLIYEKRKSGGEKFSMIKGDYYFYHTNMEKNITDKNWGTGYRVLQTLLSWFLLNGYSNIEIPTIYQIQNTICNLGIKTKDQLKQRNISLDDIAMSFCYYIDIEIEVKSFRNSLEFEENIKDYKHIMDLYKCPIILSLDRDTCYTIIGIDYSNVHADSPQVLILNHYFSGVTPSLFALKKANLCRWVNIRDLESLKEPVEVLIIKTQKCI